MGARVPGGRTSSEKPELGGTERGAGSPAGLTQGRDPIRSRGPRQRSSIYTRAQDTRTQLHAEEWEAEGRRHQRPGPTPRRSVSGGLRAQTPWKRQKHVCAARGVGWGAGALLTEDVQGAGLRELTA